MDEAILTVVRSVAITSIFFLMFTRGLQTGASDLRYFLERPGLLFSSLVSVVILVPVIALLVVVLVRPAAATTAGLLLMASSPAAPLALFRIAKAGGKTEYAVSLHLVLALLAVVTTPIALGVLSDGLGYPLKISPLDVAETVGLSIIGPILAGMLARSLFPALARSFVRPLELLSGLALALLVSVVLLFTFPALAGTDLRSYLAVGATIVAALAIGHLLAGDRPDERITLALECATRNFGLALLIASLFPQLENALPALITYAVTASLAGTIYGRYQRWRHAAADRPGHS